MDSTRSPLGIDLNEVPSPSSAVDLDDKIIDYGKVVEGLFRDCKPPGGSLAKVPEKPPCSTCGRVLKEDKYVAVCDGCERGFHMGCVGLRGGFDEWFCGECLRNGVTSGLWPLGRRPKKRVVFDINAPPPSDWDLEEVGDRSGAGGSSSFAFPVTSHMGNGSGFGSVSGVVSHIAKEGLQDLFRQRILGQSFEAAQRLQNRSTAITVPPQSVQEKMPRDGALSAQERLDGRKRKSSRILDFPGTQERLSVDGLAADSSGYSEVNDFLPMQFEDFSVLSLGTVDARPNYHDASQIWPVGYRSCWHDKVTGSLFMCEVVDGGDSGPVFKVTRSSCSIVPIPNGSTIYRPVSQRTCEESLDTANHLMYGDHEESIEMMLSDLSPPMEDEVLSCLGSSTGTSDVRALNELQAITASSMLGIPLADTQCVKDEIGEITVENRSSSSAWTSISQKLIDVCSEICKQNGACKFFCKHAEKEMGVQDWETINRKSDGAFTALLKLCSSLGLMSIPTIIKGENELSAVTPLLKNWLDSDRFGLDTDFVQEVLEQLPHVQACSQYVPLCGRSSTTTLVTVGNGLLEVKMKDGLQSEKEHPSHGLFGRLKKARLGEDSVVEDQCPTGRPLCSRIPPELVGDVYQVWEIFLRFHEVLSLQEPLCLKELEDKLINPWIDGFRACEKEIRGKLVSESHRTNSTGEPTMSSSTESDPVPSGELSKSLAEGGKRAMDEAAQANVADISYSKCLGVVLTKAHNALIKVLVSGLVNKVAALVDPSFDSGESKSRRGRKKDVDCLNPAKRAKLTMLPLNELTWPELTRRYMLAVISMDGNLESAEITSRESGKVFRCLQGDGGVLCGSHTGVEGMEADALILANSRKQIFGSLKEENELLTIEGDEASDAGGASGNSNANSGDTPEWAQVLEPVRKLPTNVGTRIRRCVHSALEKDPPEWARKILEHSISKAVYKGNASGPTKKAVLSVLAKVCGQGQPQRNDKGRKRKTLTFVSRTDAVMRQCRIALRHAAAADDAKVFCNLLGRKLISLSDNDDEGLIGSPAMVSRPLDFRTIDLRLAADAYGGSHEAFLEDVREFWNNVRIAYHDRSDLIELAEKLSQNFESLYEKEVLTFVEKLAGFGTSEMSAETKKEVSDIVTASSKIPKAPWEEGVCKVCGIDRDDDYVLLCDACDAEYHTYCLCPPLPRIPEGHWYCPACIRSKGASQSSEYTPVVSRQRKKKYQGEVTRNYLEKLSQVAGAIEGKEYWDSSIDERVLLLKFLCDELLNSACIRQHIERCAEMSAELLPKLRMLSAELKGLKIKEEILAARAAKLNPNLLNSESATNGGEDLAAKNIPISDEHDACDGRTSKMDCLRSESLPQETGQLGSELHVQAEPTEQVSRGEPVSPTLEQGSCPSTAIGLKDSADYLELLSVKKKIAALQKSILDVQSQLSKMSIRREYLGSDSRGRLYWASVMPSGISSVVVDASVLFEQKGGKCDNISASSWVTYQTDSEIDNLVGWLKDNDPKERELKESILQWQRLRVQDCQQSGNRSHHEQQSALSDLGSSANLQYSGSLRTRAASLLERKYDLCYESERPDIWKKKGMGREKTDDGKLYRCNCLELIWPSTKHCFFCHKTFLAESELKGHNNGKCGSGPTGKEKRKEPGEVSRGKKKVKYTNSKEKRYGDASRSGVSIVGGSDLSSKLIEANDDGSKPPFNFDEIRSKFVTRDSNKDLVREIGLIGSHGVPSFVPVLSPHLSDSTRLLIQQKDASGAADEAKAVEKSGMSQGTITASVGPDGISGSFPIRLAADGVVDAQRLNRAVLGLDLRKRKPVSGQSASELRAGPIVAPETSLRPVVGKASNIFRWLKISLLDMEAVLTDEALRPWKAHADRRLAWRAFVKSSTTINQLVLATIVLEDMIRTEYLKNEWWHWSSLSAAIRTSTLSSLALRIYSLDAAIIYEKQLSDTDQTENVTGGATEQKLSQPCLEFTERRVTRKSCKKKKESEGCSRDS